VGRFVIRHSFVIRASSFVILAPSPSRLANGHGNLHRYHIKCYAA
jgi:hypothetical protein